MTAESPSPGASARWPGWLLLVLLLAYTVLVFYGAGPNPPQENLHWYSPRAFLLIGDPLAPLFASDARAVIGLGLPALLLAAGVFARNPSALARALAASCVVASGLFAFYGVVANFAWKFFHWRGSAVLILTSICVGFAACAPWLARSWLRLGWPLRCAVYAPVCAAILAFVRNATGTDESLFFSISPWPGVPVFGIETGGAFCGAILAGIGLGLLGCAAVGEGDRVGARVAGGVSAAVIPMILLAIGSSLGMFPFRVGPRILGVTGIVAGLAVVWTAREGSSNGARRRGAAVSLGAALIAMPLLSAEALARWDYHRTREVHARAIIDALDRHAIEEDLYPDELEQLVAAGRLASLPRPAIGFRLLDDRGFRYQSFGTSFLLEFAAPRWVECAYTPPFDDEEEELETGDAPHATSDSGAGERHLDESWSCPSSPPELW